MAELTHTMTTRILLDGGMGRELARSGAPFRQPEWSALALIEAPEHVRRVHNAFIAAGADVITTNSYAVVPFHLGEERFNRDGRQLAALAGTLARDAADEAKTAGRAVRVAGSLPPVCGSYRPDFFNANEAARVLDVLIDALSPSVDLWLAETQSATEEVRAVSAALKRSGNRKPLWVSFTLTDDVRPGEPPSLRSGEPVAAAVDAALDAHAVSLLFNCSQPEVMEPALVAAEARLSELGVTLDLGVYANAFPPQRKDAEANATLEALREDLDPHGYAHWANGWFSRRSMRIVGGCCGIGPEHIAVLRKLVNAA
jgi:S-methylmethionine-dependent homocysteine/selenocysteine methylase